MQDDNAAAAIIDANGFPRLEKRVISVDVAKVLYLFGYIIIFNPPEDNINFTIYYAIPSSLV
jgi:hypothetical protein